MFARLLLISIFLATATDARWIAPVGDCARMCYEYYTRCGFSCLPGGFHSCTSSCAHPEADGTALQGDRASTDDREFY